MKHKQGESNDSSFDMGWTASKSLSDLESIPV